MAIIPARGGSKSIPRKNVLPLAGKSLIVRTGEQARSSKYIDRVVLSSDDEEIAAEGRRCGIDVPFMRPARLATDEATTASVVSHALQTLRAKDGLLVLLQPTSPLRSAEDIDAAIETCISEGAPACVSVVEIDKSPYWMFKTDGTGQLVPYIDAAQRPSRRQDAPKAYMLNGAVYVVRVEHFLAEAEFTPAGTMPYVMPQERSHDIDEPADFARVEQLLLDNPRN